MIIKNIKTTRSVLALLAATALAFLASAFSHSFTPPFLDNK